MRNKNIKLMSVMMTSLILPPSLLVITSCSLTSKSGVPSRQTQSVNQIQAKVLGWDTKTPSGVIDSINDQFIFEHLNILLFGNYNVTNVNQITNITKNVINGKQINLSFVLNPNTWYDVNDSLGTSARLFTIIIDGFVQPKQTQINNKIEASTLSLEANSAQETKSLIDAQFIFENKTNFFNGDNNILDKNSIIVLANNVSNNKLNISFKLKADSWYDAYGNIGKSDKEFTTTIDGFTLKPTTLAIQDLDVSNMIVKRNGNEKGTLGNTLIPSEIIVEAGDKTTNWPGSKAWCILDYVYQSMVELDGMPNIFNNLFTTLRYYNDNWNWSGFNTIFDSYRVISEGNEDSIGKLKIELILTKKYGTSATQGEKSKFVLTISGLAKN